MNMSKFALIRERHSPQSLTRGSLSLVSTLVLTIASSSAFAQANRSEEAPAKPVRPDWKLSFSLGSVAAPNYMGDDGYQLIVLPNISLGYRDILQVSLLRGIEFRAFKTHGFSGGVLLGYNFGRDEGRGGNPLQVAGGPGNDLEGLEPIDPTLEPGIYIDYRYLLASARIELRQGVNGHQGFIGKGSLAFSLPLSFDKSLMLIKLTPTLSVGDDRYLDTFFGINDQEASRARIDPYIAGGGLFSAGANLTTTYIFSRVWAATLFAGYQQLLGSAADSSLVETRGTPHQVQTGLLLTYTLGL